MVEIPGGHFLLKSKFPLADSLQYPSIAEDLLAPQIGKLIQIINAGNHWMGFSTIGCWPGSNKVYDSLFQRVGQNAILNSCHMLMQAGNCISFIYEKAHKQINTSDCGLVALAFATDLCHRLDLVTEEYDQQNMGPYLRCLDLEEMVPLSKASWLVPYHASENITNVVIFCV